MPHHLARLTLPLLLPPTHSRFPPLAPEAVHIGVQTVDGTQALLLSYHGLTFGGLLIQLMP